MWCQYCQPEEIIPPAVNLCTRAFHSDRSVFSPLLPSASPGSNDVYRWFESVRWPGLRTGGAGGGGAHGSGIISAHLSPVSP
jgi:hypothetical protein